VKDTSSQKRVGYILKKFPVLSETFILNELLELEAHGIPLHIFSLERPNDPRFHEDLPKLKAIITYVPDILDYKNLLKYPKRVKKTYTRHYKNAFRYMLKYANPSLIFRFYQSCFIANQAKRYNIGHFHSHFATRPTSVAFLTSLASGIPFSFTAHAMDIFKTHLSRRSLQKKIRYARFVVTVSDYNRTYLSEIAPDDADKIIKINNGIHLDRFVPGPDPAPSPFIFSCVARFVEKKGHPILIKACEILHEKGLDFECWLIGKGNQRTIINEMIRKKSLKKRVKLLGPLSQQEVAERYHQSHAYVLPCTVGSDGNKDGLPVSIVEALASGIPVITTPMTGIPEVITNGHNGLLVPCDDAEALAGAMEACISDKALYHQMKKNTRDSVFRQFNIHETTREIADLFTESMS
jgi:colanic acid/amylovoran biosynthesis glycosyltransferase